MTYLSEILVCKNIKDPVKLYIDTTAYPEHAHTAKELCRNTALALQEKYRAYLSTYIGFAGEEIKYAIRNPDEGTIAHENWHNYLEKKKANPPAGEFIEEATSFVIDDIKTGNYQRHLGLSSSLITTYLLVQKSRNSEIEMILNRFGSIMPDWDSHVMNGSCPWLKFIEDARYFMLYDLCFDISANKGIKSAKKIYTKALEITKKRGIERGISHLKKYANKEISRSYDFNFDISNYFPNYPNIANYNFLDGRIEIEVFGAYKTWLKPLEREIKRMGLK